MQSGWWGLPVMVALLGFGPGESRATPAGQPWNLPYAIHPLVQPGTENLLPPLADTSEPAGWRLHGASVEPIEAEASVHLAPGDEFSITVPITGARLYAFEFEFRFSPETAFILSSDDLGVNGWVVPLSPPEDESGAYPISEVRLEDGWQQHRSYFYAGARATAVRVMLALTAAKGGAVVRRIGLRAVPVTAEDGLSVVDTGREEWGERPHDPEPPRPEIATFYHRADPDRLLPSSAPAASEVGPPIALTGTPGEVLVAVAGLFVPTEESNVSLALSPLTSDDGRELKADFAWYEVCYRPRKTNYYGRGRTFRVVADSLRPRPEGTIAKANQTTSFWLRLTLPREAAAGDYRGTLTATTSAGDHLLPVTVRLLPFALVDPQSRTWGLYADSWRWTERTDDQVVRELQDMKAHGVQSVLLDVTMGDPVWKGSRIVGWTLSPEIERLAPLLAKVGLRGPLLLEWWGVESRLAEHLGLDPNVMQERADAWPPELGVAYTEALRAFDREWKARGWGEWVYVGLDEPGYWNPGTPELFRFQYRAAAAAGLPSYCTSSDLPSDPIGQPLTYHCFGSTFTDAPTIAHQVLTEARQYGQHVWFYASGSYDAQVGKLLPNRWITGFLFYKTGAEGTYSWTFQRPQGPDPFDDFYQTGIQACITYPDPEHPGENLDTPHWEAIRQGWYDYRYAATLAEAIARAKQQPETQALAVQVEQEFTQLLDSMPWSASNVSVRSETDLTCDRWRQRIAEMILRLRR